ncbi:LssY C-terminal domain-containing protein [Pseudarthrobacter sp. S9]|uniref:LssY C-terminal domain-containing protein n=1 Tax=Pseudarthrobacter sp. S9 TaxID=3418421 RepID=UPI003D023762
MLFAGIFGAQLTTLTVVEHQEASDVLPALNEAAIKPLPVYSETLTGARMEPINFIYLGSQEQIEGLFKRAGWYKADPSTLSNTLRSILVAVRNEQYLTAPVTPSYLDARPENVAFEKPTDANTLVQRHHTDLENQLHRRGSARLGRHRPLRPGHRDRNEVRFANPPHSSRC